MQFQAKSSNLLKRKYFFHLPSNKTTILCSLPCDSVTIKNQNFSKCHQISQKTLKNILKLILKVDINKKELSTLIIDIILQECLKDQESPSWLKDRSLSLKDNLWDLNPKKGNLEWESMIDLTVVRGNRLTDLTFFQWIHLRNHKLKSQMVLILGTVDTVQR